MLKRKIPALAVTGIATAALAAVALIPTAASAGTARASVPRHVAAPLAADEQVLLNDLHSANPGFANQVLTVDGQYGPKTANDVTFFQGSAGIKKDGITGPQTWNELCNFASGVGFRGTFWQDAGCPTEPGL